MIRLSQKATCWEAGILKCIFLHNYPLECTITSTVSAQGVVEAEPANFALLGQARLGRLGGKFYAFPRIAKNRDGAAWRLNTVLKLAAELSTGGSSHGKQFGIGRI